MNHTPTCARLAARCAGLLLAGTALLCQGQISNYIIDQFDTDTTADYDNNAWGTSVPAFAWNSTNATPLAGFPNTAGSGSIEVSIPWATATGDQVMVTRVFNSVTNSGDILNFNNYTNLMFDILFFPDSATDGNGSYGGIEVDAVPQSDGWPSTYVNSYTFPATNANTWVHISLPISVDGNSKLSAVTAYGIKIQQNKTGTALTGTTHFLLDNIILGANNTPPPPPTLSMAPVTTPPGLLIVAKGGGNQYNRAEVEAADPNSGNNTFSWVGATAPVTYSMTIAGYPSAAQHSGFESEIFLVPNAGAGDPALDWDDANVAQMAIFNNADGSATGSFQYKTNDAEDNAGYSTYGNLGSIQVPGGPLGLWSVTFNNDTNITLTGPGGVTTNMHFPDEATALVFQNPLSAFFGNQQGGTTANIGQGSTYSQFSITNTPDAASFVDNFTQDAGVLDTTHWSVTDTTATNNVLVIQSSDKYWVGWTLPDTGFTLQTSLAAAHGVWANVTPDALVTTTLGKQALISTTNTPSAAQGFYRLAQ